MFKLFKRKSVQDKVSAADAVQAERLDGLTEARARLVCTFQASVESAGGVDYAALQIALASARKIDKPCNLYTLRASYNEAMQADVYRVQAFV